MQQITPESGQRIDDRMRDALDPAREPWHLPHMTDRNLYAPLRTDDDLQLHRPVWPLFSTLPACCGACDQGRKPCVTPEACRLTDTTPADPHEGMGAIAVPFVIGVAALALFAVLAVVHFWRAA